MLFFRLGYFGVERTRFVTVDELVTECLKLSDRESPPIRMGSQRYAEIVCKFGYCKEEKNKAG